MKIKSLFLVVGIFGLVSSVSPAFGQLTGGLGFFKGGIHTIQYSELNSSLPSGYPQISNKPFVTAGAGYGIIKNFVIGGEGGTLHAGSFNKDNQQVDLAGDYGYFSVGYVVYHHKGYLIYPLLSIGSNTQEMYIHQKEENASFENVTGEPFQATTLKNNAKMMKVSVAGVYTLKGSRAEKITGGLMLGFEAGYQMNYKKGVWTYDGGDITDGPDFSSNGFFIQLLIGGGGVVKK